MDTNSQNISQLKQTAKVNIKTQYWINKTVSYIWVVAIEDEARREFIARWLSDIWLWAVVLIKDKTYNLQNICAAEKINSNSLIWFDFFVYDNNHQDINVVEYMKLGIVPIMPEKNTFSWILKEFNPMKFEWNWFFYKSDSPFCIFEKIISYLENIKFPEDKRVLVKNVISTF